MKVLFSGGGTLGSVTPLLAVAEAIAETSPGAEFLWVGTKDGPERALVEKCGIRFVAITSGRWRRFLTCRNLLTPFLVLVGFVEALGVVRRFRPDAVIGAGGFVAVPVVWAAWLLRRPVHIHQLDWRPGLANRLSAPFARTISVTFEKSQGDFSAKKVTVTGNPIRRFLFGGSADRIRQALGLQKGLPVILVLGGGTGAVNLNRRVVEALPMLGEGVQVLHLTGRGKGLTEAEKVPATYRQVDFLAEEMADAYAVADLVVTRAGMGVLTELAALGKPAIVVPMPSTHQEDNARFFVGNGAAVEYDERKPSTELAKMIHELLADEARRRSMAKEMRRINSPEAGQRVAALITQQILEIAPLQQKIF